MIDHTWNDLIRFVARLLVRNNASLDLKGHPDSIGGAQLKERRTRQDMSAEELRRLWQDGIESGPGRFKSIDAIKKEARRRVAKSAS